MKRFGLAVSSLGLGCALVYACAAPEELTPDIVVGGERQLYDLRGGVSQPAPAPSGTVAPPGAEPSATAAPSAFAPLAVPPTAPANLEPGAGDEVAPPNSIPLQQWLQEQRLVDR